MLSKRNWVATPISEKINFKPEKVKTDKDEHYIMIKGTIHEEDIPFLNIYTSCLVHKILLSTQNI